MSESQHSTDVAITQRTQQSLELSAQHIISASNLRLLDRMIGKQMNNTGRILDGVDTVRKIEAYKDALPAVHAKMTHLYELPFFAFDTFKGKEEYTEEIELTKKILGGYMQSTFDPGLSRDITFHLSNNNLVLHEKGAHILRRSTFMSEIDRRIKADPNFRPTFSFIDIAQVRKADHEVKSGHKAADLLLNRAAKGIEQSINDYCSKNNIDEADRPLLGRYGGDEFVIAWPGTMTEAQRREFKDIIRQGLGYAYYVNDSIVGQTIQYDSGPIKIKDDQIEWITMPEHEEDRIIFNDYLSRGLLLNEDQVKKVKAKYLYRDKGQFSIEKYQESIRNRKSDALDTFATVGEKIDHIARRHEEFSEPLFLARYWDEQEEKIENKKVTKRQDTMLSFVQDVIYDKLLGDIVSTKFDFQEHEKRGEFSKTIVIDLKFIKEMNSLVGYVDADESIAAIWNKIYSSFNPQDKEKVIISRVGGTFFIGIKNGMELGTSTKAKLSSITALNVDLDPTEGENLISIPVGQGIAKTSTEAIDAAERVFYGALYEKIKGDANLQTVLQNTTDPFKNSGGKIDFNTLLWHFFKLKRYDERLLKLIAQAKPDDPVRQKLAELYGARLHNDPEEKERGIVRGQMVTRLPTEEHILGQLRQRIQEGIVAEKITDKQEILEGLE